MSSSTSAGSASTTPYLIRALHEWCTDNGYTPYLSVFVDGSVQVPYAYVKNQEIVLSVSWEATQDLQLGNEYIAFNGRFGGVVESIMVPVSRVLGIFAKETGQGMGFEVDRTEVSPAEHAKTASTLAVAKDAPKDASKARPSLKIVK